MTCCRSIIPLWGPCAIEFWLVCYGTYGRITHVVIPRLKVVIFDLDVASALSIAELLECHLKDFQAGYEAAQRSSTPPLLIGVMDMTFNYGHQLMNHLSGLERLIRAGRRSRLDARIVDFGREFFPIQSAVPELAQKIVRVADRWETYHLLKCGRYLPLRVGTNVFYNKVGSRILRQPSSQKINARPTARNPLVAVTIRSAGRQCLNLPIVVQQVAFELIKIFPNLGRRACHQLGYFPARGIARFIAGQPIRRLTMRRHALRRRSMGPDEGNLLPGSEGWVGATAHDNRLFVEAVLYRYRPGIPRARSAGAVRSNPIQVHTRFSRWAKSGVWARAFQHLAADPDNEYAMIDSTIVRAHQHSAGAQKKTVKTKPSGARAAD